MSRIDHRIGLTRDETLDVLADERFRQLTNWGDQWGIAYRDSRGECGEIFDADFDRLIERWGLLLASWDERSPPTDEGVEETTAGLPTNPPNEQAYIPDHAG